jgi:hypothetical protein
LGGREAVKPSLLLLTAGRDERGCRESEEGGEAVRERA